VLPQPLKPAAPAEQRDARILALDEFDRRAANVRALRHAGALIVQCVVLLALVSLFFLRLPLVDGHSMAPQIEAGDRVLINTLAYDLRVQRPGGDGRPLIDIALRPVDRGDVVAFVHGAGDDRRIYLKRVVGLGGDRVALRHGDVLLDGVKLADGFGADPDDTDMAPVLVPAGSLFVLGDNRGESDDSRSFGPIPEIDVIGRAAIVAWPPNRARAIR
jgi:signal peptidase I